MSRLLLVFVDALGPTQLEAAASRLAFAPHRGVLSGILGYSSGALATLLTGAPPKEHGRMCLFSQAAPGDGLLRPMMLLGLLPRFVHERGVVRRLGARALARFRGLSGYVALHKVPPAAFSWLDLPEREDLFLADEIGGQETFLQAARARGLRVQAARWALPESQRFDELEKRVAKEGADLVFAYAAGLDGVLHAEGNGGARENATIESIALHVERLQHALRGDGPVTTVLVGDHGMADVTRVVDPRSVTARFGRTRHFVDSTFLRIWGSAGELDRARHEIERAHWPAEWLDRPALESRAAPTVGSPYGDAMVVLREGTIFAPSFVGGVARGMHGYDLGTHSSKAAIASDAPLPESLEALTGISALVRQHLELA